MVLLNKYGKTPEQGHLYRFSYNIEYSGCVGYNIFEFFAPKDKAAREIVYSFIQLNRPKHTKVTVTPVSLSKWTLLQGGWYEWRGIKATKKMSLLGGVKL